MTKRKIEIEQLQFRANTALNQAQFDLNKDNKNTNIVTSDKKDKSSDKRDKSSDKKDKSSDKKDKSSDDTNDNSKFTVENLITNLKIISNIKPNEKIFMNNNNIIEIDTSYMQSITRFYHKRSRSLTIDFLKVIISHVLLCTDSVLSNEQDDLECITDYNNCTSSDDFTEVNSDILQRFILEINKSFDGLDNLIKTYEQDITIVSEITVMKESLQTRCNKINNILQIKK